MSRTDEISTVIDEKEPQRQMRAAIRQAVLSLYGPSEPNVVEWTADTAKAIKDAMKDYLELPDRRPGSDAARADWSSRLDDYEERLRVLLNPLSSDYWEVHNEEEEEEVARFLLRLCFTLRNKEREQKEKGTSLQLIESRLEESLLSPPWATSLWSNNHYYTWRFVWTTIDPGAADELPDEWRSKFGKAFNSLFLGPGAPFEPEYQVPDPLEYFDAEHPTLFANLSPGENGKQPIKIACTIEDATLRDPTEIAYIRTHEEFRFSDKHLTELQSWMKESQKRDDCKARIRNIRVDGNRLELELQPVKYSCYQVTNLPISLGMRFLDPGQWGGRETVLDLVCPREPDGSRRLPRLDDCEISNHLGVDCIVITSDGYMLMYRRLQSEMTDPNTIGFAPSIAMDYYVSQPNRNTPIAEEFNCVREKDLEHTPPSAIEAEFARELGEEATLKNMHEGFEDSRHLLYLGTFREWARGGKPEMYFLTYSPFTLNEHNKFAPKGQDAKEVFAPSRFQDSEEFRIFDGVLSSNPDYDAVRSRLWSLVEKRGETLQESAKAGIYLLYNACETEPDKLREFFAQFQD